MTGDEVRYTDVVCIGAGFAGICLGAQLQRQLGVDSFHIYEREASVGGTWFKNQYPGVMCDVPSIVYSLSFAPRRDWSDLYAPYQEILAYLNGVSHKFDLERRTSLRTEVTAAAWDDERKRWRVTLRNVDSGAEFAHECKLLFTGVGQFGRPRTVEDLGAVGRERFRGPILLSTGWDHSVDLTGKRVVLIGNGCTGNQILPALADKVESIVQLSRSRHWIVRDERQAPAAIVGFMGRYVPWIAPIFRKGLVAYMERNWIGFPNTLIGLWLRRRREKQAREYIKKRVPAKYLHMLIPEDVPFNCKRRILDERELYTSALHKPNVLLAEERVVEFQENAVVTDKGTTYPADAVILATGFLNNDGGVVSTGLKINGRNGLSLQDYWTTKFGGPEAYDTVAVSGFPNMFMLLGPNSLTGHTSALLAIENGVDLALKLSKSVLKGKKSIVEVKPDAERKYYDKLHAKLATSVWGGGCHSYYTRGGHNASTYPWSQFTFWWRCKFPTWGDWIIA